jgi:acetyl-CoA acetyltransferase
MVSSRIRAKLLSVRRLCERLGTASQERIDHKTDQKADEPGVVVEDAQRRDGQAYKSNSCASGEGRNGGPIETARIFVLTAALVKARVAAQRAYESAHLTRKSVEVVEVHDAFSPFSMITIEDLGICGPGEAPDWFEKGWVGLNGRLPVNPSGGVVGRGHPVAASGLAEIAEVALQLRGEAGAHSIGAPPRVGLAQTISGIGSHNFVTILGREAP